MQNKKKIKRNISTQELKINQRSCHPYPHANCRGMRLLFYSLPLPMTIDMHDKGSSGSTQTAQYRLSVVRSCYSTTRFISALQPASHHIRRPAFIQRALSFLFWPHKKMWNGNRRCGKLLRPNELKMQSASLTIFVFG